MNRTLVRILLRLAFQLCISTVILSVLCHTASFLRSTVPLYHYRLAEIQQPPDHDSFSNLTLHTHPFYACGDCGHSTSKHSEVYTCYFCNHTLPLTKVNHTISHNSTRLFRSQFLHHLYSTDSILHSISCADWFCHTVVGVLLDVPDMSIAFNPLFALSCAGIMAAILYMLASVGRAKWEWDEYERVCILKRQTDEYDQVLKSDPHQLTCD